LKRESEERENTMSQDTFSGFEGMQSVQREAEIPMTRTDEAVARSLEYGLEAAPSIKDRSISLFSRGELPHFAGITTFLKAPFLEDVRKVGQYDVVVVGEPLDTGATYRAGTRFGPQAVRRISALYTPYNFELGVDLSESLTIADVGDVYVIPANIEKSFDQVAMAVSHIYSSGAFPVLIGGDHSLGYPNIRGIAPHVDGNIGIIHLDRHIDLQETDMDERMHTTPWFHATNISNAPPSNLIQIGIGGWQVPRAGVKVGRERRTNVLSMADVERIGIEKTAEIALELAWKNAKAVYLSVDIDCLDAGFVPGTGWPEPGGFLPREVLKLVQLVAREGLCSMEVVEVSPPYDVSDTTALMALRIIVDTLATLVHQGKLPNKK
jgi:agmatinase